MEQMQQEQQQQLHEVTPTRAKSRLMQRSYTTPADGWQGDPPQDLIGLVERRRMHGYYYDRKSKNQRSGSALQLNKYEVKYSSNHTFYQ